MADIKAIDKEFDYLVPDEMAGELRIGTMVRVRLAGRRVGGWVVEPATLAQRLRGAGVPVALMPRDGARGTAGGCTVVGARAAAWAPVPDLAAVAVLDAHDEGYVSEAAPTWNAWRVAARRAENAGVPC